MDTITCAIDIASGNSLMALYNIEFFFLPYLTRSVGKAPLTAYPSPFHGIAEMNMPVWISLTQPFASNDIQIQVFTLQRFQRPRDKTLSATIRTVLLAD